MTTTELIKILKNNEHGGISHKPREISLTINGKYMPNPQIALSSTGDGIVGPEIDLDIDGKFFEEQEPCEDCISRKDAIEQFIHWWSELLKCEKEDETFDNILKALPSVNPQEPKTDTLDKIREEISAIAIIEQVDDHTMFVRSSEQVKQVVLDIIDKYRRNDNAKKSIIDRFRDAFSSFHL